MRAKRVQRHIKKNGVRFHLSDGIQKFAGNKAVLSSGKEIAFDVLVVAVGVRPNTETAKRGGNQGEQREL